jgi:peptide methionine sulfoxide reductase MsrA
MTRLPPIVRVQTGEHVNLISSCSTRAQKHFLHPEYRSAIFTHSPAQLEIAKTVTEEVQKKHFDPKGEKIVTEIREAGEWWDAEQYHQKYLERNPTGYQCPTHRLHW